MDSRFSAVLIATAAILIPILLVGYMNARDIRDCIANGHSKEVCYATFNP